jgi:NAD+ kinase
VLILGAPNRDRVQSELKRLQPIIAERARIAAVDLDFAYDFSHARHDFVIVLGGDGSLLQAARQMGVNQLPVIGINCGHLGFLAALHPDAFVECWAQIAEGAVTVVPHLMLQCAVIRNGVVVERSLGLNEVAVLGGPPFSILDIHLHVDGVLATTYSCDGLLISTPIGSTAYNLSAGGPILRKSLQAFVISPLNPHTLTYRPVVDTADRVFELIVPKPQVSTSVVVDGRILSRIFPGDTIRVERAAPVFRMITAPGQNDYRTLREKLGWGGRIPTA